MPWTNETRNTDSFSNQSRNTNTFTNSNKTADTANGGDYYGFGAFTYSGGQPLSSVIPNYIYQTRN